MSIEHGAFEERLEKLNIPEIVRQEAKFIYSKLCRKVTKGNRLNQVLFFCIYISHIKNRIFVLPIRISKICNLKDSPAKAFSKCTELCKKYDEESNLIVEHYKVPNIVHLLQDYVPLFCEELNIDEKTTNNMVEFAIRCHERDGNLSKSPINNAAAVVAYYISKTKMDGINVKLIKQITGSSDMTIEQVKKRLRELKIEI